MAAAKAAAEAQKVVQMGQLDDLRASIIAERCASAKERDRHRQLPSHCEECALRRSCTRTFSGRIAGLRARLQTADCAPPATKGCGSGRF